MKPIKLVSFVLLATAFCAASTTENTTTASGCPVNIYRSHIWYKDSERSLELKLWFRNTSQKAIIGTKFGLELMDATGDFSPYITDETDPEKVKPNGSEMARWPLLTINNESHGYRLTVKKVAFSDGTVWEDNGTSQCRVVEDSRQ